MVAVLHPATATSATPPSVIDSLLAPARTALDAGRLAESDSLAARVAASAAGNGDSLLWLEAIRQQNRTRLSGPRMTDRLALPLADSALALAVALQRRDDVPVLMRHRGKVLHTLRRFIEAERMLGAARLALLALPRVDTLRAAQWLVEQSEVLYTLGRYSAAIESLQIAVHTIGSMARPDTVQWATAINGLASTHLVAGATAAAESLWWFGLRLRQGILPPDHPDIGQSLSNLATARHRRGDYDGAVAFYEQSVRIYEKQDTRILPFALDGLAIAYNSQGRPLEARRVWERAVDSLEAQGAGVSSQGLRVQSGLGQQLSDLGDHPAARAIVDTVHARYLRLFGPSHRETATSAGMLARELDRAGERQAALVLARGAVRTLDSLLGPQNDRTITTRAILALILQSGDSTAVLEAELIRREQLAQARLSHGSSSTWTARVRLELAQVLIARGSWDEAARQVDSVGIVFARSLSGDNPLFARLHRARAALAAAHGMPGQAVDHALAAVDAMRAVERVSAREFSEREAIATGGMVEASLGAAIVQLTTSPAEPARVAAVWDRIIEFRMRALDAAARRRRLATRPDSTIRAQSAVLEDARGAFARQWVRAARDTAPPDATVLATLRRRMEAAERALAAADPVFAAGAALDTVSGSAVRAAVPRDEALVAYWRTSNDASASYVAFVRGPAGVDRVFPLGPAASLEAAIERLRVTAGAAPSRDDAAAATRAWQAARTVTERIWTPLLPALAGARRIHVVPDHALVRVPFAALTAEPARYWLEAGAPIIVRACERELIAEVTASTTTAALVVGAPDFGTVPARRRSRECVSLADVVFAPLPGAQEEASGVARTLGPGASQVELIAGHEASEAAFIARAPHRRFLHVATHAFVLGESCEGSDSGTRGVGRLVRPSVAASRAPEQDRVMLEGQVGLAFAGANRRVPGRDDGILTAEEIVSLDLADVDCAVLSACETGVGPLASGEGALGLHRAFRIAGARSVVMSLWALSDRSARDWSLEFWSQRVLGRPTWEAAWGASRRRLEAARRGEASAHPFHWAAFTAWAAPGL